MEQEKQAQQANVKERKPKKKASKTLIICLSIFGAAILMTAGWMIYSTLVVKSTYDRAEKEYNKAYNKAQKDIDRALRDYSY